ncbi:MAG: TetR/AcrR family transcriptional regulator C-terminal domain-containing protein [Firmicutes bacterium]|nr:TetR/AcrR family transcriptional regulator C-terminal domain-containing protein [Bacillota bacterium]
MVRKNAKVLIEQALIDLLQDTPLDSIDVQDIAAAAGLSRQTFYYNFNNKHDLLCWILEQDTAAATEAFRRSGKMYDYVVTCLSIFQEKSVLYRNIAASDAKRRIYVAYFENGMIECAGSVEKRSALGRMSASLWDSLHFFTFGASGMMQRWVENGMQQTPEQLAESITRNMPPSVERYFRSSER